MHSLYIWYLETDISISLLYKVSFACINRNLEKIHKTSKSGFSPYLKDSESKEEEVGKRFCGARLASTDSVRQKRLNTSQKYFECSNICCPWIYTELSTKSRILLCQIHHWPACMPLMKVQTTPGSKQAQR